MSEVTRRVALDGAGHAIWIQLTGGAFLTGYALALGATPNDIGLLAAIPLVAKLSQLYTSWRVERRGHWKASTVRSAAMGRLALLAAVLLPAIPAPGAARLWLLILALALSAIAGSVFELGLLTWIAELVPSEVRTVFLARRNAVMGAVGLVTSLAAAWGLDRWRASPTGGGGSLAPFATLFGIGVFAGALGLASLMCVPPPRRTISRALGPSLREALRGPVADARFRHLITFAALWGVGIGVAAPFFTVYLLEELKLSFLAVTALSALSTLSGTLTATYWGRLSDHFGAKPVLRGGTYLLTITPLLWLAVTPTRLWPLIGIHIFTGIASAAFDNTINQLVLNVAPTAARPTYLAHFAAAYAAAQAVAPLAGGALVTVLASGATAGTGRVLPYAVLFVVTAVVRALATPALALVVEPRAVTVARLIEVMGRFRRMSSSLPMDVLYQYGYMHLARIADYIARERTTAAGTGAGGAGESR